MAAVKAIFPDADVAVEGLNKYPIKVKITRAADNKLVWSGSQKDLFRKYAKKRTNAIKMIKQALQKMAN